MKNKRFLTLLLSRTAIFAFVGAIAAVVIVVAASAQIESMFSKTDRKSEEVVKEISRKPAAPARALTTAEQDAMAAELVRLANKSTDGLKQVKRPDGSVSVDLQTRFQDVMVARVNSDGSVSTECFDDAEAAARFVGVDPRKIAAIRATKAEKSAAPKENGTEVK